MLFSAAARQLCQLPSYHLFAYKTHSVAVDLAERRIGIMPAKMSRVFFNNCGSEANDTAVRRVWCYNYARGRYRKKTVARLRGYHGVTVAAGSLTGILNIHRELDLPTANIRHADCLYTVTPSRARPRWSTPRVWRI